MRYALVFMLTLSAASYAADPFSCVEPDVADAFLGNLYQGRGEYSTSIPDGFTPLNAPADFSLVGSRSLGSMTTVIYKTTMDAEQALDAAVGAIAKSGWTENVYHQLPGRGGFQSSLRPIATMLCHDDEKAALSVFANDKLSQTFVSYSRHSGSQGCGDTAAARPRHDPSEMMRQLPTLKLPKGAKASNTGMGGSGDEVTSRVDISGTMSRSELLAFFEDQIKNQSWQYQTNWNSRVSSGSVWMLNTAKDGILIGTLHIYDSGAAPIRVRFSVNRADRAEGPDRGSWSGTSH